MHVIQRGNNRTACFYADEDYALYLHHLTELALRFGCTVHAYVLMINPMHLLSTPVEEDSASLLMKHRYFLLNMHLWHQRGILHWWR